MRSTHFGLLPHATVYAMDVTTHVPAAKLAPFGDPAVLVIVTVRSLLFCADAARPVSNAARTAAGPKSVRTARRLVADIGFYLMLQLRGGDLSSAVINDSEHD